MRARVCVCYVIWRASTLRDVERRYGIYHQKLSRCLIVPRKWTLRVERLAIGPADVRFVHHCHHPRQDKDECDHEHKHLRAQYLWRTTQTTCHSNRRRQEEPARSIATGGAYSRRRTRWALASATSDGFFCCRLSRSLIFE